jgi:predicted RNase H-like HicB family nuclease
VTCWRDFPQRLHSPTNPFLIIIESSPLPQGYIAFAENLPGANTQAETLEGARVNLWKLIEVNRKMLEEPLARVQGIRETLNVPGCLKRVDLAAFFIHSQTKKIAIRAKATFLKTKSP